MRTPHAEYQDSLIAKNYFNNDVEKWKVYRQTISREKERSYRLRVQMMIDQGWSKDEAQIKYDAMMERRKKNPTTGRYESSPLEQFYYDRMKDGSDESIEYVRKITPKKVEVKPNEGEGFVPSPYQRFIRVFGGKMSARLGKYYDDWTGETLTYQQVRYREKTHDVTAPDIQPVDRFVKPPKGDTAKRYFDKHTGEFISYRQYRKLVDKEALRARR